MVKDLYENMAMLLTTIMGGQNGHIGLIMRPELYATLYQTPYAAPEYPGSTTNLPI